ncbi:LuxR C-terminal-related transcriptional regulator [Streptomyces sp. NPDC017086]|uniref:LuxR C-terminal-related transcriptional regulator n=1 Tax=Streptomyces sp. NPDC017086 TaxID=3364976 RepID=UPI00379CA819
MLSAPAPLLDPPLRGRDRELARIAAVLEATRRGGTALILVEAPPGYGKTRLLRAAMDLAERLGYRVTGPGGALQPVPGAAGTRTADTLPGRHDPAPPVPGAPVLVVVDELQDLDAAAGPAGAVLTGPGVPQDRVVWLAALRTGTGHDRRGALLSDPRRHYERLVLGALDDAAALRLAADLLGVPPGPAVARLVEQAGGHPRLLTELLTGMREEGTIRVDAGEAELAGVRLPDRVRVRLRTTLAQYSRECRQFLSVAAVLGTEVEYTELSAMLGRQLSALLPVMEEACATGMVRHAAVRLAFQSGLMRQAVQDAMPDALKRVLYQEAALLRAAGGARPGPAAAAGVREPDGGAAARVGAAHGRGSGPHRAGGRLPSGTDRAARQPSPGEWTGREGPAGPPGSPGPGPAGWAGPVASAASTGPVGAAGSVSPAGSGGPAGAGYAAQQPYAAQAAVQNLGPWLSRRQRELVQLVSEGLTNRQAATRLGLSPHTVNYHLRRLFKSYGVNSRIDLLRAVAEHHRPPAGPATAPGAGPADAPLAPMLLAPLPTRPVAEPAPYLPVPRTARPPLADDRTGSAGPYASARPFGSAGSSASAGPYASAGSSAAAGPFASAGSSARTERIATDPAAAPRQFHPTGTATGIDRATVTDPFTAAGPATATGPFTGTGPAVGAGPVEEAGSSGPEAPARWSRP